MNINDLIHGFRVRERTPLPELGATMWRMEYEKNGADLVWLERPDDNKTFAIAFKTIPQDDTGVFHILEHSVLNGSEKYPVREPFVELLKSSLSTFLNAFTFPDKTMYPVSSRNSADFLNLMDVYLDAVLHPLCVHDDHAFLQEGWHYEPTDDGKIIVNGVVFNEMKGDYSNPESRLRLELLRCLFPDSPYGFSSGGDPAHIPELTYERYCASHARFYHPSNSRILLDGEMDLDAVLAKIDSFLCDFDRIDPDADIPMQAPVKSEATAYYEIGPEDRTENKALLARGWVYGAFDEPEKTAAVNVLSAALAGTNDAPLKKALLDAGICEDLAFGTDDGMQQNYAYLVLYDADETRAAEAWQIVEETLRKLVTEGLDHNRLRNVLRRSEFVSREKDYGRMPRGIVYAIHSMDAWLYGGDPALGLRIDDLYAELNRRLDEGWFEAFLREAFLDNPHAATVALLPSKTLGAENAEAERKRLAAVQAGWSETEAAAVAARFETLRERQQAADTPEQLATLPRLQLADIPEQGVYTAQEARALDGTTVLYHDLKTDGITYLDLIFDISDLTYPELTKISMLSMLLCDLATEHYSPMVLSDQLEGALGRFVTAPTLAERSGVVSTYFTVQLALLDSGKADAARLTDEILNRTRFDDPAEIGRLLRQSRIMLEQDISAGGNRFAAMRALAMLTARSAVREAYDGVTLLRALQALERGGDEALEALCAELSALAGRIFTAPRLMMSLTGAYDEAFLREMRGVLSDAPMGTRQTYAPLPKQREGFVIPAEIGYAAKCAVLGTPYNGAAECAGQMLTYDYLWNTVRVQGGAYGTGWRVGRLGDLVATSYRDPNTAGSLKAFSGCGEALRSMSRDAGEVEKYIISAVGNLEPVETPRAAGGAATSRALSGITNADLQRQRSELLATTPETLAALADAVDAANAHASIVVIGGQNVLDACELDEIQPLQMA